MDNAMFSDITTIAQAREAITSVKDNALLASLLPQLGEHLANLEKLDAEAKARKPLVSITDKLLGTLPEYSLEWRKDVACQVVAVVTRAIPNPDADDVEVEVVKDGEKVIEKRKPMMLVREVTIGMPVTMAGKDAQASASKRTRKLSITIYKGGNPPELVGNYRTSAEACANLGIDTKGDSATRKLASSGYLVQSYDGDDFLLPT